MNHNRQVRYVIFDTIKKQKILFITIVCAVVAAVVLALIPPLILARIVDRLTVNEEVSLLYMLLYFGMLAMTGLMESVREGLLTVFGQKMTHALRSSLMEKFGKLSTDNLNRQEPGTLVARFVGDVDTVENLFTSGIISMFADACKIVSILAVIWFQNRGLSLVLLVLLPFLFGFTRYVQKRMLTAQIENRKAMGRASAHVPETLHNIRTIHCLRKESYMEEKYDQYIGASYRAMERTNFYDASYSPVILILNAVVVAVVMLLSASGNANVLQLFGMSAGTAVAVINYISQIFGPIESLGMEIQTIQSAIAGIHRINEFFNMEEKKEYQDTETRYNSEGKAIAEFKNVTFGYGEQNVLEQMSFRVNEGEQVTLLGRTGAGKSTILKLILGLYEPQKGEVLIHGIRATEIGEAERRKLFGYVEQTFHMVPGTVRDQITLYDRNITEDQIRTAVKLTGLTEAIEGLEDGYDTVCTQEIFSQGQWQLLSIARAVVAEPSLLLLDEITANLDAETERVVLDALKCAAQDRTVISISHRTSAELGKTILL